MLPVSGVVVFRLSSLREGERVCSSPHPPLSGPPSPQGEGQERAQKWARLRMSGVPGCRRPHPPRSGPPPRKDRVKSGEWRVELSTGFGSLNCNSGRSASLNLIHRKRSPFRTRHGFARPTRRRLKAVPRKGATLPYCGERSVAARMCARPGSPAHFQRR